MLTKINWIIIWKITEMITGLNHNCIKLVDTYRWFSIESRVVCAVSSVEIVLSILAVMYVSYLIWVTYKQFKNKYYRRSESK